MITLGAHVSARSDNGFTTGAIDTTGANLLGAVAAWYSAATAPVLSDSKGNTWTPLTSTTAAGDILLRLFIAATTVTVGSGHTFSLSGSGIYAALAAAAFSGASATLDGESTKNDGSGTTIQANILTPTVDDDLILAAIGFGVSGGGLPLSINQSFTVIESQTYQGGVNIGCGLAYRIQTTAAAVNPTWTFSDSMSASHAVLAAVKAAVVAATGGGRLIGPNRLARVA